MRVLVSENITRLELSKGEPMSLLQAITKRFSYNDYNKAFSAYYKAMYGVVPDYSSPEVIEEFIQYVQLPNSQSNRFQNWLCLQHQQKTNPEKPLNFYNYANRSKFKANETWSGYKSYLRVNGTGLNIPTGALRTVLAYVKKVMKAKGIDLVFEIDDRKEKQVHTKLSDVPVYSTANKVARDHQKKVVDLVRDRMSSIDNYGYLFSSFLLDLAVNFGKSLVTSLVILNFPGASNLSLVNSQVLFKKTIADYVEAGIPVHFMCAKGDKSRVLKFLQAEGLDASLATYGWGLNQVAMVQTLLSKLKGEEKTEVADKLGTYEIGILDECDMLVNNTFSKVYKHTRFGLRIAMSGTAFESASSEKRFAVWSLAGQPAITYSHVDMVKLGFSLPIEYRVVPMDRDMFSMMANSHLKQSELRETEIFFNPSWQQKISNILTNHQGEQILIYMGSMQIDYLEKVAEEVGALGHTISVTHGKDPKRDIKIRDFKNGNSSILLSNVIISTGVNMANMDVFVYASLSDSVREFIQALVGRSARVGDGQEKAIVYDFEYSVDFGKYHTNSKLRQSYARRKDIQLNMSSSEF